MRIKRKSIVLALILIILGMATMSSLFSLRVFAIMNPTLTITGSDTAEIKAVIKWVDDVNKELDDTKLDSKIKKVKIKNYKVLAFQFLEYDRTGYTSKDKQIDVMIRKVGQEDSFSGKYIAGYNDIDTKSRNTVMSVALSYLNSSENMSRVTKVKLYNFIYNSDEATASLVKQLSTDTRADFYKGYSTLKDFGLFGGLSWVLGVLSIIVFALLALTLTIDLAYINIPAIQYIFSTKEIGRDKRTLEARFISYEARHAVELSEQSSAGGQQSVGRSAVTYYLNSKSKQMTALFICLLYLVSGKVYILLAQFMDMIGQAAGV